jgi:hypothetical protein
MGRIGAKAGPRRRACRDWGARSSWGAIAPTTSSRPEKITHDFKTKVDTLASINASPTQ